MDVLGRRFGGDQVIALEDEAKSISAQGCEFVRIKPGYVASREQVATAAGPVQTADDVH